MKPVFKWIRKALKFARTSLTLEETYWSSVQLISCLEKCFALVRHRVKNYVSFYQRGYKIERNRSVNKKTWAEAVWTSLGSRKTILSCLSLTNSTSEVILWLGVLINVLCDEAILSPKTSFSFFFQKVWVVLFCLF